MPTLREALEQPGRYASDPCDVAVAGAGHAGCEAALAAARLGFSVRLFTLNLDAVANLPCNPSIGGTAKGQLVREIDAMGGIMGRLADETFLQFRMLNASRGPAVRSPRMQVDRRRYQAAMKRSLEAQPGLQLRQGEITALLVGRAPDRPGGPALRIEGVLTRTGAVHPCRAVVVATGTYLDARIVIGELSYPGGPDGLFPALGLGGCLRSLGLPIQRFKTGTPARVHRRSLDFSAMEIQPGDARVVPFSFSHEDDPAWSRRPQLPCHMVWTTPETRSVILSSLHRSPLFSGAIEGTGPRYCPSIEDKFVRFPDKERHQVFLEPTGAETDEIYLQGFSSSLPEEIQVRMVRSLPGCARAEIMRTAYAIEYDCLDPTCLRPSLESRTVGGLFFAGQVNGSSGYEEAAAQGLLAGLNAARSLAGRPAVVPDRSEAYMGVLVDDLVTKGTREPYRMMTSRAEYRLVLRQDNADLRLRPMGWKAGLVDAADQERFLEKQARIAAERDRCTRVRIAAGPGSARVLESLGSTPLPPSASATLSELLKRPEIRYDDLAPLDPGRPSLPDSVREQVEILVKYEGYIAREEERIERFRRLESRRIPPGIDYSALAGLRLEARQKLAALQPGSLGQAARISGVSPADISVLMVLLEARKGDDRDP